jgi:hypothetical protein
VKKYKRERWEGLNGYRNKFRVTDTKQHKSGPGQAKKKCLTIFFVFFISPYILFLGVAKLHVLR